MPTLNADKSGIFKIGDIEVNRRECRIVGYRLAGLDAAGKAQH
jgi:hypothetical protein